MNELSKIVVLVSLLYLVLLAARFPQIALSNGGKYRLLEIAIISGLVAVLLFACGAYFTFVLP
jgi:hypothetical protein